MITLASVIVMLALAFGIASLAFPKNMSEICENFGNYKLAASYAERQYEYTGSTEDLYRCTCLYIRVGDRSKTVKFCGKLVDKQDFKEYCGPNAQYIYSNYATALYLSGNDEKAVEIAEKSVEDGFVPNTYAALTVKAVEREDKVFGGKLLSSLEENKPLDNSHLEDYNAIETILKTLTGDET